LKRGITYSLIAFSFIIFIAATAGTYLYLNLNKVKKFALVQLNNNLNATINAKNIDVSFIKTFPVISLKLSDVVVTDFRNKEMLTCESFFLGFDLFKLLKKEYEVQSIKLFNGKGNFYVLKNSKSNFDIIKSKDTVVTTNDYIFNLNHVKLVEFEVNFNDYISNREFNVYLNAVNFSGAFSNKNFKLSTTLDATLKAYISNKKIVTTNKLINLNTVLFVDTENKKIDFSSTEIGINKLRILANGNYVYGKKHSLYADIATNKLKLTELISLLPLNIPESFYQYKSDGVVYIKGSISGNITNPIIKLAFGADDGKLTDPASGIALSKISFTGEFVTDNNKKSKVTIKNLTANMQDESKIDGTVSIVDLNNPIIDLNLNANIDLATVVKYFRVETITTVNGKVSARLHLNGKLDNNLLKQPGNEIRAQIDIKDLRLKNIKDNIKNIAGLIVGSNGKISINDLSFTHANSNYNVSFSSNNIINFLFDTNQQLTAELLIKTNFIDLKNLPFTTVNGNDSKPLNINLLAKIQADAVVMDAFKAEDITATCKIITFPNLSVLVEPMLFKSCGGTVSGNIQFIKKNYGYTITSNDLNISNLRINELFKSFDNFGQTTLVHQHLNGLISSNLQFVAPFDQNFNLVVKDLKTVATVLVKDGKLIDFKPLYALSKFVKLSELQQLSFSELSNTIHITNGNIFIPTMDIKNNAINLQLTGSHSFNNDINYEIKLKLNELLKNKRSKADNEFGEEPESGNGLNLFLTMTGKADNPVIKYHTKAVKTKIKESAKAEKQNIINIIRQETGFGKKDSTIKKLEKKNNNEELEFEAD
jgi:hypothetical protein